MKLILELVKKLVVLISQERGMFGLVWFTGGACFSVCLDSIMKCSCCVSLHRSGRVTLCDIGVL